MNHQPWITDIVMTLHEEYPTAARTDQGRRLAEHMRRAAERGDERADAHLDYALVQHYTKVYGETIKRQNERAVEVDEDGSAHTVNLVFAVDRVTPDGTVVRQMKFALDMTVRELRAIARQERERSRNVQRTVRKLSQFVRLIEGADEDAVVRDVLTERGIAVADLGLGVDPVAMVAI